MKLRSIIQESRRLNPAIITMKRGTVIDADHMRIIKTKRGADMIVAGLTPGRYEKIWDRWHPHGIKRLRDFYYPFRWVPRKEQDMLGWSEPDEDGYYDAKRRVVITAKFGKIFTINPENVASIKTITA